MANPRFNNQVTNRRGAMKGGRMKKMGGGMTRKMYSKGAKPDFLDIDKDGNKGDTGYTGATGSTGSTGATGAAGTNSQLSMTWSSSTSDADPGAGKIAFNNGTLSSVSILYVDDADDASADISGYVQSWDDVTNTTAKGIVTVTKEGTPSTYAMFKVSGSVTDASGYTKVPVTHVVSSGSFSNTDGVGVHFSYSGNDGSGDMTSFTLAGTSGSNQTITNGNTLTIAAGTGISTTGGSTDTVTIAVTDDPVALAIALG